jgi:hypothetical protein
MEKPSLLGIIARTLIEFVVTIAILTIFMTPQNSVYWPTLIGLGAISVGVVIIRARRSHRRQTDQGKERTGEG